MVRNRASSRPTSFARSPIDRRVRTIAYCGGAFYTVIGTLIRLGALFPSIPLRQNDPVSENTRGERHRHRHMPLQTLILAMLVIGFGCAQYLLALHAIRDLIRRPRVRGGNKVSWGLAILCLPIAGALIYSWMGPVSFIRRAPITAGEAVAPAPTAATRSVPPPSAGYDARRARSIGGPVPNVTPIRGRHVSAGTERPTSPPLHAPSRARRTGS